MKRFSRLKLSLLIGFAFLAIGTTAVSTMAWFTLKSAGSTSMISGSPELEIKDVYGYRHDRGYDSSTGLINYQNNTVTRFDTDLKVQSTNTDQGKTDTSFDVPGDGVGIYLIKKNPGQSFKYKYQNTSMATKFHEYLDSFGNGVSRWSIGSISLSNGDAIRIKKYSFIDDEGVRTVNTQIPISTVTSSAFGSVDAQTGDVNINATGTYRVWLANINGSYDLSLEETGFAPGNLNIKNRVLAPKSRITINSDKMYFICPDSVFSNWGTITDYVARFKNDSDTYDVSMTHDDDNAAYYAEVPGNDYSGVYFRFKEGNDQWQADGGSGWPAYSFTYNAGYTLTVTNVAWLKNEGGVKHATLTCSQEHQEIDVTDTEDFYLYDPDETYGSKDGSVLPKAYAWKTWASGDAFDLNNAAWPGVEMTRVRNFFYKVSVPSVCENVIFSNGSDSNVKTANLTWTANNAYNAKTNSWYDPEGSIATSTTYYVYDPDNHYDGNVYVYYWSDCYTRDPSGPSNMAAVDSSTYPGLYSVEINNAYDHLLFCKNTDYGNKTEDLEIPNNNGHCFLVSGLGAGNWTSLSPVEGDQEIKLYDPDSHLGAAPKIYAYESTISHYPTRNAAFPGLEMTLDNTHSSGKLWTATVSADYDMVVFANSDGSVQTDDISIGTNKIFVTTGVSSHVTGSWYASLASETENTYYYYDSREGNDAWSSPYAYAWSSTGIDSHEHDNYTIFPYRNNDWPGIAMTPYANWSDEEKELFNAEHSGVNTDHVFKITVSESYDKIIFNKGLGSSSSNPGDQTINVTTTDKNGKFFVLAGDPIESGPDINKYNGSWVENVFGVSLKASFFINDKESSISKKLLSTEQTYGFEEYEPSFVPETNITVEDRVNAILYQFTLVSGTWYSDESCDTPYTKKVWDKDDTLYVKYNVTMNPTTYRTFYADLATSGAGNVASIWTECSVTECAIRSGEESVYRYFNSDAEGADFRVAKHLYRITMPNNWDFRLTNYVTPGDLGGNNWSDIVNSSTNATNYLHVYSNTSGNNCSTTWCSPATDTTYGSAKIQYFDSGTEKWTDFAGGEMQIGDGTNNYFMYEQGLQIGVGTRVRVHVEKAEGGPDLGDENGNFNYDEYVLDEKAYPGNDKLPYYLRKETEGTGETEVRYIKTAIYNNTARFNFYITNSNKLSIAMVPDRGNGYYIMKYNASYGTVNYIDAKQMASNNEYSAKYFGYFVEQGDKLYIRSYLNAVDKLYKNLVSKPAGVTIDSNTGVIDFGSNSGYYNISVNNGTISIAEYNTNSAFALNSLDTAEEKTADSDAIEKQKTGFVMEVQFKATNTQATTISVKADNGLVPYAGVALYCSDTPIGYDQKTGKVDPGVVYELLNTYRDDLSTDKEITDQNALEIPANSEATYYAYILIDYLPGIDYSEFENASGHLGFYLCANQAIAQ